jgi:hypothetical protein
VAERFLEVGCSLISSLVTIASPHPPASIHVYLHYSGRGRGSPASQPPPPEYLLTQHSYKETSAPLGYIKLPMSRSFLNSGTLIVIILTVKENKYKFKINLL